MLVDEGLRVFGFEEEVDEGGLRVWRERKSVVED